MKQILVSQLDHEGFFVSATYADESPEEPGEFHLPGGCVAIDPPDVPEGKRARLVGDQFVLEDLPSPEVPAQLSHAQMASTMRLKAKHMVNNFLPLLTSMQVDAMAVGAEIPWGAPPVATPLATVIRTIKNQLQAIPDGVDLSQLTTFEQMETAIQAAYLTVVAQAPAPIREQFSAMIPR